MTLEQTHAAINQAADSAGVSEVLEALITRLTVATPGDVFANGSPEFHRDALETLEALMVRHCGARV